MIIVGLVIILLTLFCFFLYGVLLIKEKCTNGLIFIFSPILILIIMWLKFDITITDTYRTINPSETTVLVNIIIDDNKITILSDTQSLYIYQYAKFFFD